LNSSGAGINLASKYSSPKPLTIINHEIAFLYSENLIIQLQKKKEFYSLPLSLPAVALSDLVSVGAAEPIPQISIAPLWPV
jgi:hypothetical protein